MPLDKVKRYYWKKKYNWKRRGIDVNEASRIYDEVKNCQICGTNKRMFHIDHCHKTGKIRGLLCSACNRGLGYFNDNPETLRKAADYVDREGNIVYTN